MNKRFFTVSVYLKTFSIGIMALLMAISIVMYPSEAFHASVQGLQIWWEIIFPSLLPFFITSEILLGFGVVHFIGILLEPLMKPLFNVPGAGAFVLAMGFASGYPMGAKLTSHLREQKMISKVEGERLVSFTSTSDPLFLFGAIAIGFFHDPQLGAVIAFIHYTASIIVGILMRFYQKKEQNADRLIKKKKKNDGLLKKAFKAMHQARIQDGRKFGKLMGDAVMSSINTLFMIGGFIILFSVILTILTKINIILLITKVITYLLIPLGISTELSQAIIHGFFEVTLGAKTVSEASMSLPMIEKIAIVSVISAWSGISVHAQVAALLQKTDIRYTPFFFARIIHSIIAFILTFLVWKPLQMDETTKNIPAFMYWLPEIPATYHLWDTFIYLGTFFIWFLFILMIISLLYQWMKKIG